MSKKDAQRIELDVIKSYRGQPTGVLKWEYEIDLMSYDYDPKDMVLNESYLIGSNVAKVNRPYRLLNACDFVVNVKDAESLKTQLDSLKPFPTAPKNGGEIRKKIWLESVGLEANFRKKKAKAESVKVGK